MLCFSLGTTTLSEELKYSLFSEAIDKALGCEEKIEKTIETAFGSITVVYNYYDYWLLHIHCHKTHSTEDEPACKVFNLQSIIDTSKVKEKIIGASFLEHAHVHWVERLVRTQGKEDNEKTDADPLMLIKRTQN